MSPLSDLGRSFEVTEVDLKETFEVLEGRNHQGSNIYCRVCFKFPRCEGC